MPAGGKSLIIRADAGTRMGTGHVMRCLGLAQAWQDAGGEPVFASARITPGLESRLSAEGMEIARLSGQPGSPSDALQTAEAARGRGARWIVVDGYQFGGDYQQAIKRAGMKLLVVDDNGHAGHYWADLVLSQNLHAQESLYQAREPYTRLLLGTRYVLLRREFRQWQGRRRAVPAVARRLLVTMGGGDPDNVTLKVLQALEPLEIDGLETRVVVGNGNPHHDALRAFARDSRIPTRVEANVTEMPERMAWADAAVTAGGTTTWELAYFGVPSITMILADNQEASVNLLMRRGVFPTLGWANSAEAATIRDTVQQLLLDPEARERHRDRAAGLVDGAGVDRVMQLMNSP